jgi:glycosyltransferase involved in cell wall biosynthesis
MKSLSVVIVCHNEADIIGKTLESLKGLTDDIIVYDSGSTDGTKEIVKNSSARLIVGEWMGYGPTKKLATSYAKYDWILSLDADESLSRELLAELLLVELSDPKRVYELRFLNHIGDKPLRFGEWGGDKHLRVFNRGTVLWNEAPVHEELVLPDGIKIKTLKGYVWHFTARSIEQYEKKNRSVCGFECREIQATGPEARLAAQEFFSPLFIYQ